MSVVLGYNLQCQSSKWRLKNAYFFKKTVPQHKDSSLTIINNELILTFKKLESAYVASKMTKTINWLSKYVANNLITNYSLKLWSDYSRAVFGKWSRVVTMPWYVQ